MLFNTDISLVPFYCTPQGGADFRLTDTESGANAKRARSAVIARIPAGAHKSEVSGGNHISQPVIISCNNRSRVEGEQRKLRFFHGIIVHCAPRVFLTVTHRRVNRATVNHTLCHKFNFAVKPCTARRCAVRYSIRQINTMTKHMTTKTACAF